MDTHKNSSNFWFGMLLGAGVGSLGLYFFGTKKGRKTLQKILDNAENIEVYLEEVLNDLGNKASEETDEIREKFENISVKKDIGSVLEKIRSIMPDKKEVKKYFVKDGKVLK